MTATDAPVARGDRYDSLDILRGLAVLMIFSVNVRAMLQPFWVQGDPSVWSGPHDLAIDRALQFAVDGKWMSIFAMLFGAGLMLIHDKTLTRGVPPRDRIVRRQLWLMGFGLVHMLLIWLGDILVSYGVTGLVVMTMLGLRSRTIAVWAAASILGAVVLLSGLGLMMSLIPPEELAAGGMTMTADLVEAEVAAKAGGIGAQILWRLQAGALIVFNSVTALPFLIGYMLVGVLGYRSGFLLAQWNATAYAMVALPCLAAAWSIDAWRIGSMGVWDGADGPYEILVAQYLWAGTIEGLLGGIGYAALVMALVRAGVRPRPLAAAGRMAFTNYILCSVIGTTLAAGHGGGLLGELTLAQAMGVVGVVWLAILVWSPLWLSRFRYGPLEWLWRSLSYGEMQAFLISRRSA